MKYSRYILWLVALLPLMLLRDYTPGNELRYLNIADDALADGHFFAFFNAGVPYADKPPLYLWIVMFSRWLWGTHSLLWLGLFSILPGFVVLWIMDRWTATELKDAYRNTAQLVLLTTAYFIGGMVVLRMDMLMTMFIVLALYTFYRIYSGHGRRYDTWQLPAYVFGALFTKGPYGVMIPVVSICAFLILQKQGRTIGRYLGWRFWIPLFAACALWFGLVYAEGGSSYLNDLLFNQTINRAVDSFSHKRGLFFYVYSFTYALAPWSLLFISMLVAFWMKRPQLTVLEKFFLTVFLATFVTLSLISSKLEIYLLPIYPFIAYFSMLMLHRFELKRWPDIFVSVPILIFVLVFPVICILPHCMESLQMLNHWLVYLAAAILTLSGIYAAILLKHKKRLQSMRTIVVGLLVAVFVGSFFIPNVNSMVGYGELAHKGKLLAEEYGTVRYLSYKVPRSS